MVKRIRSLKQQTNYAFECQNRLGTSRRADRLNHVNTLERIYSIREMIELKDFTATLIKFLNAKYPEVRMVKDITEDYVQAFVYEYIDNWSYATTRLKRHLFKKFAAIMNKVYYIDLDFSRVKYPKKDRRILKDHAMEEEDYEKLVEQIHKNNNSARFIPEATASIGTRIEEVCSIKPEEIDLYRRRVFLNNCKNGRKRVVTIQPPYFKFWRHVKRYMEQNDWPTVSRGVSPKRISALLRQAMVQARISEKYKYESNHAIRKMYARRRFREEREKGHGIEKAWTIVQWDLGHGKHAREDLYKVYIGGNLKEDLKNETGEQIAFEF